MSIILESCDSGAYKVTIRLIERVVWSGCVGGRMEVQVEDGGAGVQESRW